MTCSDNEWPFSGAIDGSPKLVKPRWHAHFAIVPELHLTHRKSTIIVIWIVEIDGIAVGREESVKVSISIVIREGNHDSRPLKVEAQRRGLINKGPFPIVDIQSSGAIEATHCQI